MAKFITGRAMLAQTYFAGKWHTLHNQLFLDDDNRLYFVPRYFVTDGYTIPKSLALLGGGKMEWDIRPAIQHDFECKYHKIFRLKKELTLEELRKTNILRDITKNGITITVCENIEAEFLEIIDSTFNQANSRFKRSLKALDNMKNWRINMMRFAVNFNIGWIFGKKELEIGKIYKDYI